MKTIKLDRPPRFLTHHLFLRPDCLARLTLPTQLSQEDASRIVAFVGALVVQDQDVDHEDLDEWPFDIDGTLNIDEVDGEDPDGDLNEDEIEASEHALKAKERAMIEGNRAYPENATQS